MAARQVPHLGPVTIARFWEKITVAGPDDCWLWSGWSSHNGYGRIGIDKKQFPATHVALTLDERPRLDCELMALHSCDNPPCCNPAHLRWGTHSENMIDRAVRGRHRGGWPRRENILRGEMNAASKLTDQDVLKIRASPLRTEALGRMFGVSARAIRNVQNRSSWSHLR